MTGQQLDAERDALYQDQATLEAEELRAVQEQLLHVERAERQSLLHLVDNVTARKLDGEVEARLVALKSRAPMNEAPVVETLQPAGMEHSASPRHMTSLEETSRD